MRISEGKPYPLGATADADGANFAVFSAHATRIDVCIFDAPDGREIERFELPEYTDEVFHGHLTGHRPRHLLRLSRPRAVRARGRTSLQSEQAPARPLRARSRRQADLGPGGVRLHDRRRGRRPDLRRARQRAVRAEMRGRRPQLRLARRIPEAQHPLGPHHRLRRRTSKASPSCIPRWTKACAASMPGSGRSRSSTTSGRSASPPSSSCPSTRSSTTSFLLERGLRNYWGYNSIGFFAPDPRYAADVPNSLREFKEMIARLHDGGLEVILDVVYNHTAEGNERGPTLSFKGIDNRSYYRLCPTSQRYYINDTGTGNTLNLSHPARHPDGRPTPCATGRARCGSTASASISARSWRASRTASRPRAAFSRRSDRTRCSRKSS